MQYELFYLIGASKEADLEKIKGEAEEIVKKAGGEFSEKTTTEKRRLSYSIKHETHGIYIARRFELAETENLHEITRKLNLNEGVLRFIISKAAELPELKSKEERMNDTAKTEVRSRNAKEEKKQPLKEKPLAKEAPMPVVEKKEEFAEKTQDSADLDKKLEEILNI